jgi:lysozyme family protein
MRKMTAFDQALKVILHHEGGYVNHPKDPGGITNLGVTKNTWEAWTKKPATAADMRALNVADVAPLYRARYWDLLKCDQIPAGLALCVFDFGVNAGPARAARYLQQMVGAGADGKIGPASIAAVKAAVERDGEAEAVRRYQQMRRGYYRQLSTFNTFGRGWLRRVDETETEALRMVA